MKTVLAILAVTVLGTANTALSAEEAHDDWSVAVNGRLDAAALENLRREARPNLLSVLDRTFQELGSKNDRQIVAVLAITSGSKDERYIRYLESFVSEDLKDPAPNPFFTDPAGPMFRKRTSIRFQAWCQQRGMSVEEGLNRVLGSYMNDISYVVLANDRRFWPILAKAAQSSDPTLAAVAAGGLAELDWQASLPLILDAADRLPDARRALLLPLAFISNPDQRQALDRALKTRKNPSDYEKVLRVMQTAPPSRYVEE